MVKKEYKLPKNKVLTLKVLQHNRMSDPQYGFIYPEVGKTVEAKDWDPKLSCGGGLHGFLWGTGRIGVSLYRESNKHVFQVHEVAKTDLVILTGKVKYRKAKVVFESYSPHEACKFIQEWAPAEFKYSSAALFHSSSVNQLMEVSPLQVGGYGAHQDSILSDAWQIGGVKSAQKATGWFAKQFAASRSKQVAESGAIQYAGDNISQEAKNTSIQRCGDESRQEAGRHSVQLAGSFTIQEGSNNALQKASHNCRQKAGPLSIQQSGFGSWMKAGFSSVQVSGLASMYCAGINSVMIARDIEGVPIVAVVDGVNYMPDTWYQVLEGKFVPVPESSWPQM